MIKKRNDIHRKTRAKSACCKCNSKSQHTSRKEEESSSSLKNAMSNSDINTEVENPHSLEDEKDVDDDEGASLRLWCSNLSLIHI